MRANHQTESSGNHGKHRGHHCALKLENLLSMASATTQMQCPGIQQWASMVYYLPWSLLERSKTPHKAAVNTRSLLATPQGSMSGTALPSSVSRSRFSYKAPPAPPPPEEPPMSSGDPQDDKLPPHSESFFARRFSFFSNGGERQPLLEGSSCWCFVARCGAAHL